MKAVVWTYEMLYNSKLKCIFNIVKPYTELLYWIFQGQENDEPHLGTWNKILNDKLLKFGNIILKWKPSLYMNAMC